MVKKHSNIARRPLPLIALLIGFALLPSRYTNAQESAVDNTPVNTQPGTPKRTEETFTLDFNNIDLHALIKIVSTQTGKSFIVDPGVKARVNFISSEPVGGDKLYDLFLSVLEVHGFAAVDVGAFTKIVPTQTGVQSPTPLLNQQSEQGGQTEKLAFDDELVTHVIRLQGMQANEVVTVLSPLLPITASLSAEPASNSLVITAHKANIEKLVDLIQKMANP